MTPSIVTTVLTAASSQDLVSLANLKLDLGITGSAEDAYLSRAITQASAVIAQFCDRVFAVETLRDVIRVGRLWPIVNSLDRLQLSRWPIRSVATVVQDGAALTVDVDFNVDSRLGQLIRIGADGEPAEWRFSTLTVTYDAGFAPIPADVEDAVIRTIKARRAARTRDPSVREESVAGVREAQYWAASIAQALTPDVIDILTGYRMPVIG